jgi:hypothetical protein
MSLQTLILYNIWLLIHCFFIEWKGKFLLCLVFLQNNNINFYEYIFVVYCGRCLSEMIPFMFSRCIFMKELHYFYPDSRFTDLAIKAKPWSGKHLATWLFTLDILSLKFKKSRCVDPFSNLDKANKVNLLGMGLSFIRKSTLVRSLPWFNWI